MVSATLQVSLSLSEVFLLEEESKGQMAIAIRERLDALARGEKAPKLKAIGPATVAAQIIRRALPGLEVEIEKDKKGRLKK
jgi:type III secretion system FlhB-like substrate exporter